jgi:hypothetical protein
MSKQFEEASEKYINNNNALYAELGTTDAARGLTALRKLKKDLAYSERYNDELIQLTGADNLGNAMKVIRSVVSGGRVIFELPEELTKFPELWLNGRLRDGKDMGFPGMSIRQCEKEYRYLRPLLEDAWKTAIEQEDEEIRESLKRQILEGYQILDPSEFSRICYGITNNYEIELRSEKEGKTKVEKGASNVEIQRVLNAFKEKNYGVGGTLEQPTWD